MRTCQYSVNLLGEKISTESSVPIVAQTKQKSPTINVICNVHFGRLFLDSIHLMCFVFLSVWHLLYRLHWMCHSERHCLSDWWVSSWKRSVNSLWRCKLRAYLTVHAGSSWVDPSQRECGAENMVICPQFKCITKPCFVGLCIEDWNLPLSSVSPGWVIHLGLLSCLLNKKPAAPHQPPTLQAPQGLSQS